METQVLERIKTEEEFIIQSFLYKLLEEDFIEDDFYPEFDDYAR